MNDKTKHTISTILKRAEALREETKNFAAEVKALAARRAISPNADHAQAIEEAIAARKARLFGEKPKRG